MIYKKNQSLLGSITKFFILAVLLAILSISAYYFYINFPRAPKDINVNIEPVVFENLTSEISQFYPNMKFNHNQLSFDIDSNCNELKKQRMLLAFDELGRNVPSLSFYPVSENPDIKVSCTEENNIEAETEKHFVAGEGGAKEIIRTGRFNVINEGIILLYENSKIKTINCDYPNVELHELMHIFGFDHVNEKKSLMYPLIESCDQFLDTSIIKQLNHIYEQPNLPDLYFEDFKAIKKGRYIDFNLTIKNSGSVDSDNSILTILDDNQIAYEKDIMKFKFGHGLNINVKNLKLIHLNSEQITFIIDKEDKIKEIDEKNNIADLILD